MTQNYEDDYLAAFMKGQALVYELFADLIEEHGALKIREMLTDALKQHGVSSSHELPDDVILEDLLPRFEELRG